MTTPLETTVIDTHALVWHLEDNPRLSSNARIAFTEIDQGLRIGVIPTIVLAEVMYISERGRTGLDFGEIVDRLQNSRNFRIASFDMRILVRMPDLTIFELHDRIIVATAQSLGAQLMTRDRVIRDSGVVGCIW